MKTTIIINEVVPGLNGDKGLIREHYRNAKKRKERYFYLIRSQSRHMHQGPVKIVFTRHCIKYMDWDNMCASFKHLGDALESAGIIKSDKPTVITKFFPKQVKVSTRAEEKTTIEISDL